MVSTGLDPRQRRQTKREISGVSAVAILARLGYGARGVAYLAAGTLSLTAAFTADGAPVGAFGAIRQLLTSPFGWIWPILFGAGFACFALWRLIDALYDVDRRGSDWTALRIRAAYVFGGVGYAGLALASGALALGLLTPDAEPGRLLRKSVALVLSQPAGAWLVIVLGLGVAVGGLAFVWRGLRGIRIGDFLPATAGRSAWSTRLGRAGFAARGLALVLVGGYLGVAGWLGRADTARGMAGALAAIENWPFGWLVLSTVALGFMAFGLFSLAQSIFRRIGSDHWHREERPLYGTVNREGDGFSP
jgi:hypothetical protein